MHGMTTQSGIDQGIYKSQLGGHDAVVLTNHCFVFLLVF